jgi:hypothetical protein
MNKTKAVTLRFMKGFFAGGLAQVAVYLGTGITISTTDDLKKLGYGFLTSFLIGGILALEKAITWE